MIYTFLLAVVVWGCSDSERKEKTVQDSESITLEAPAFKKKLETSSDAVILDVRTPGEFAEGIIPGAIIVDYNAPDFNEKIAALDKNKSYFLYCKAGIRSLKAQDKMKSNGFKKLYSLKGGYDAWVSSGYKTKIP